MRGPLTFEQRYRTGAEGRISHLKRSYGMNRSRLKGNEGRQIWTGVPCRCNCAVVRAPPSGLARPPVLLAL